MNQVNLIPARRLAAKARARCARRWAAGFAGYCCLLPVVYGACHLAWGGAGAGPPEVAAASRDVAKLNASLASLRAQSADTRRVLMSIREVSDQPDWSLLLAAVARGVGEDVVLTRCQLSRRGGQGGLRAVALHAGEADAAIARRSLVLHVDGLGRSQDAVAQFALRLERVGVFAHVNLLQSNYQAAFAGGAIAFGLECPLGDRAGEAP